MSITEDAKEEGTLWRKTWETYLDVTQPLWKNHPEILAAGWRLVYPYRPSSSPKQTVKSIIRTLREIARYVIRTDSRPLGLARCDALFYYTSPKKPGSIGPIEKLVARLTRRGYVCAVLSSKKMTIRKQVDPCSDEISIIPVTDYEHRMKVGFDRHLSLRRLCRALVATMSLYLQIIKRRATGLIRYLPHPIDVFYQLLMSVHRFDYAHRLLQETTPRLMITMIERKPMISELVLCNDARNLHKVLYHYDLAISLFGPIHSNEIWAWNSTAAREILAKEVSPFIPDSRKPTFNIVGNAEIEDALEEASDDHTKTEKGLQNRIGNRPVLLYLSQYGPFGSGFARSPAEAIRWIGYAVRKCPEWHFIIKTRPLHHDKTDPRAEKLLGYDNVTISRGETTFKQFLRWKNKMVVCGIWSIGLYVAAGASKIVLRFLVPSHQVSYSVMDEVTIPVRSQEALVHILRDLHKNGGEYDSGTALGHVEDLRFPYRGRTIDRMESLCLECLEGL